ncbi:hypothetical protein TNIN_162831, partial [Trichonephila inaurata madagascariensis]
MAAAIYLTGNVTFRKKFTIKALCGNAP